MVRLQFLSSGQCGCTKTFQFWHKFDFVYNSLLQESTENFIGSPSYFHGWWSNVVFFLFCFLHSSPCCPHPSFIVVTVLVFHWSKKLSTADMISWHRRFSQYLYSCFRTLIKQLQKRPSHWYPDSWYLIDISSDSLRDSIGCLNIHNSTTNNNVMFFFVSDLKIVYYNNY